MSKKEKINKGIPIYRIIILIAVILIIVLIGYMTNKNKGQEGTSKNNQQQTAEQGEQVSEVSLIDMNNTENAKVEEGIKENTSKKLLEEKEYKGLKIIQNKKWFCFGIDSVLLSDFAKEIKNNSTVLDLGSGTGIISILLSKKINAKKIVGIEIQKEVYEMSKKSIILNDLENVDFINEDIKNLNKIIENNSCDAIVTNPPYMKKNSGIKNENEMKLISRHEIKCNIEDIIKVSSKLLKDNGELYMVHRPDRIVGIIEFLRKYKIEPKKIRFVYSKKGENSNLVLIKAVKNAGEFLKIEKPLYIYDENNKYTDEVLEIYNKK